MNLLVLDNDGEGMGIDLALRAQDAGHAVRYWLPPKSGPYGQGLVQIVPVWEPQMESADLVVLTGNSQYGAALEPYFAQGYPIFGANQAAAAWELDRAKGQGVLARAGVKTAPYKTVDSLDAAIEFVRRNPQGWAIKPWGGEADKAMTCVAADADEALFMLSRWKRQGLKGQLMLQEKVEGIEMGISGFFSPAAGWLRTKEESWEHKKFMNDDLGCNTGEQGTVIRHLSDSKLFDAVLEPLTDQLYEVGYVGDCSVNCIIDREGVPWPLEFTMRLGWPDFCIRQAVFEGDPIGWMAGLLAGQDLLVASDEVVVGVVLSHGDYPSGHDPKGTWAGFPLSYPEDLEGAMHWQQVMYEPVPKLVEGQVKHLRQLCTAGNYIAVATGVGAGVSEAAARALGAAWAVKVPSNLMFRTDIGRRLEAELPVLQKQGFALRMAY